MPKRHNQDKREAEFAEFAAGFRQATTGTLWRKYDGDTVSVFFRKGTYHWCIASEDELQGQDVRYSHQPFETQDDALIASAKELFVVL